MDYEVLLKSMNELVTKTKNIQDSQKKLSGTITKDCDAGNLKAVANDLNNYADKLRQLTELNQSLKDLVESFDSAAYLTDGDFETQMIEYCKQMNVDVIGESGMYEMFPYKIKLDATEHAVTMNNKKIASIRPKKVVETVRKSQEKLSKSSFNAQAFGKELLAAYDILLQKKGKKPGTDLPLKEIYNTMVPMARLRKTYELNSFAYDISRFIDEDKKEPVYIDGRRMQAGPARSGGGNIRLVDANGKEFFMYSVNFTSEE